MTNCDFPHTIPTITKRPWESAQVLTHTLQSAIDAYETAIRQYQDKCKVSEGGALWLAREGTYPLLSGQLSAADGRAFTQYCVDRVVGRDDVVEPLGIEYSHNAASATACLYKAIKRNIARATWEATSNNKRKKLLKEKEHGAVHAALGWARIMLAKNFENVDELARFLALVNAIELHFPVNCNDGCRVIKRRLRNMKEKLRHDRSMQYAHTELLTVSIAADEQLLNAYAPLIAKARKAAYEAEFPKAWADYLGTDELAKTEQ